MTSLFQLPILVQPVSATPPRGVLWGLALSMRPLLPHPVPAEAWSGSPTSHDGRLGILPTGCPWSFLAHWAPTGGRTLCFHNTIQPSPVNTTTQVSSLDTSSQFINKISTNCENLFMFTLGPPLPQNKQSFLPSFSQSIIIEHISPSFFVLM